MAPFTCELYGQPTWSEWRLPAVQPTAVARPALTITRDEALCMPDTRQDDGRLGFALESDAWWFDFPDSGVYRLTDDTIAVRPGPGANDHHVADCLTSRLVGLVMRRRGRLVLHANVVGRNGRALLRVGRSGAGKTTLTRALLRTGFEFLSDDLAVVEVGDRAAVVQPGPGRLKVRRDGETQGTPLAAKTVVARPPYRSGLPVHAVVLVEPTSPWSFDRLKPSESALHLVRHAHLPRSLGVTGDSGTHLERASRLVATVPTYQLNRGEGRTDLDRSTRRLADLVAGGAYS